LLPPYRAKRSLPHCISFDCMYIYRPLKDPVFYPLVLSRDAVRSNTRLTYIEYYQKLPCQIVEQLFDMAKRIFQMEGNLLKTAFPIKIHV